MAKKTKKTAGEPATLASSFGQEDVKTKRRKLDEARRDLEDHQVERALDRAAMWTELLEQLDRAIDHANRIAELGLPIEPRRVQETAAKLDVSTGDARFYLANMDGARFCACLERAENRLPLADGYHRYDADAVRAVRKQLEGGTIADAIYVEEDFGLPTPSEVIADAIKAVRKLYETDIELSRRGGGLKSPTLLQRAILTVLVQADGSRSSEEIATEVKSAHKQLVDAGGVQDAIGKLRSDCGFESLRSDGKRGYRIDNLDRERAASHGIQ